MKYIFMMLMLVSFRMSAQQAIPPLKVGDKLPAEFWTKEHTIYANGKTIQQSLMKFKGKPLILDFWASWCGVCLGQLPKVDSLQILFGGKFNFVSASYQSSGELVPFLKARYPSGPPVEHILGDIALKQLFPYREIPHYIWIDADATVIAMTGPAAVTKDNLLIFAKGEVPLMEQKEDIIVPYDRNQPLFSNSTFASKINKRTSFSPFIAGITGGLNQNIRKTLPEGLKKISVYNASIPYLYRIAYGKGKELISKSRMIIEVKDINKLSTDLKGNALKDWEKKHTYCYELQVDDTLKTRAWSLMVKDLDSYFEDYKVSFAEQMRTCYVLVKKDNKVDVQSAGGQPMVKIGRGEVLLRNVQLSRLISEMNLLQQQHSPYPLVDGTGITAPVDLAFTAKLSDLEEVNKALSAYGLAFIAKEFPIKVLKITDALNPVE